MKGKSDQLIFFLCNLLIDILIYIKRVRSAKHRNKNVFISMVKVIYHVDF